MRTCPQCGNEYRKDVDECPNDGAKLGPTTAAPPPGAGPPGRPGPPLKTPEKPPKKPPKPKRQPGPGRYVPDEPGSLRETSTAKSWIIAGVVCLLLLVGFAYARERLLIEETGGERVTAEKDETTEKKRKVRKKGRKGKRRRPARTRQDDGESYDDYDWSQDYVEDDSVLGDVLSEPDHHEEYVVEKAPEPEPYEPTRAEYQPSGRYSPRASYSEPGANSNVVELDLGKASSSAPLDEVQVKRVLNERRLAPCYDRWVQKIPQMKGRVWMEFVVAPDGHVASVKVTRSELRSRVVEKCLVDRARKLRFPRSEGGQRTKFDTHFDFTNR